MPFLTIKYSEAATASIVGKMLGLIIFFCFCLSCSALEDATRRDAYGVKLCSFSYAGVFLLFCIFPPAGGIFIKAFLMSNLHICFLFFCTAGRAKPSPFCQATDTLSIQGIVLGSSSLFSLPPPHTLCAAFTAVFLPLHAVSLPPVVVSSPL